MSLLTCRFVASEICARAVRSGSGVLASTCPNRTSDRNQVFLKSSQPRVVRNHWSIKNGQFVFNRTL